MNKLIMCFCVSIATIALTGCEDKTFTVNDFKKDDTLRAEFLQKCKNGEIRPESMNCINSKEAEYYIRSHKFEWN